MVRMLYISGMVFFALLIGDTAHRLHNIYLEGTLFDAYNSERKAAVILLAVSSCGFATLCLLEMIRLRRRYVKSNAVAVDKGWEKDPVVNVPDSSNIYSAPKDVDAWEEREPRIAVKKMRRRRSLDIVDIWMRVLRIYCGVLPVIYTYIMINYLFFWLPSGAGNLLLSILFPVLLLGSVLTSIGILRKKTWGRKVGFAVAVFHLLIFPVGTFAGFIMLMGLMVTTSEFDASGRRRRPTRKRRKMLTSAS